MYLVVFFGAVAVVVGASMWLDGTWKRTDAEYQQRIDARKKARAAKAANRPGSGAKR